MTKGRIRIGTSGGSCDHWQGAFYPAGLADQERLADCASCQGNQAG